MKTVEVYVKPRRWPRVRYPCAAGYRSGSHLIKDVTPIPHNGCVPRSAVVSDRRRKLNYGKEYAAIAKRCKALGISPAVMGYAKKNTTRNSNGNMRKKQSEYASQLKEKQKVKFIYGVLEKQFHNAYLKAESRPGKNR